MKIKFAGYTYWDGRTDTPNPDPTKITNVEEYSQYEFDQNKFNKLVDNREFGAVVDYLEHFHFDDEKDQQELQDLINVYKEDGAKLSAIYSNIRDKNSLAAIEVYDSIFEDGGLDRLKNRDYDDLELKGYVDNYIKQFEAVKNTIGGGSKSKLLEKRQYDSGDYTGLSITFAPEKQKALGIDWLKKDNLLSVTAFYQLSGLTKEELEKNGVEIVEKDGFTTLTFDKSNALANKILYNIPHTNQGAPFAESDVTNEVNLLTHRIDTYAKIHGTILYPLNVLKSLVNGEEEIGIKGYRYNFNTGKREYNGADNSATMRWNNYLNILDYQKFIQDLETVKNDYFNNTNLTNLEHSVIVGPALYDDIEDIMNDDSLDSDAKNKALRTNSTFNAFKNALSSIYSGSEIVYSNYANKDKDDERNHILSEVDKHKLLSEVLAAALRNPSSMTIQSADNGKYVGTYISILPNQNNKDNEDIKGRKITLFIPNFMRERAQQMLNRNTTFRAARRIADMESYGYDYKTLDGDIIEASSLGTFKNGEVVSKEQAVADINKDMSIQDIRQAMLYQCLNPDGNVINVDEYEAGARAGAINVAYDIYGNDIKFASNDGTKYLIQNHIYDISDIINGRVTRENTPSPEWNIIKDIQYIYDNIMKGLNYYK